MLSRSCLKSFYTNQICQYWLNLHNFKFFSFWDMVTADA